MTVYVKPYIWDKDTPKATPGAMIRRADHKNAFLFIPLVEMAKVSDALIDLVEQHEAQAIVKGDTTTNDASQALGDL